MYKRCRRSIAFDILMVIGCHLRLCECQESPSNSSEPNFTYDLHHSLRDEAVDKV